MDIPAPQQRKKHLELSVESWPTAGTFTIARGSRTAVRVIVATVSGGGVRGRGECVPYGRYGETVSGVTDTLRGMAAAIEGGLDRDALQEALPPGAARNALDCALWDYEARASGVPVWRLAGLSRPAPLTTAYTLSLGTPDSMGRAAAKAQGYPLLKVKLGGDGDPERLAAVRAAAPAARLIADANEAWSPESMESLIAACGESGVEMIEQPLPRGDDDALKAGAIPFCADESCHDRADLPGLPAGYAMINIKLDKTGGLTEALALREAAAAAGLRVMVGCMVGTSLGMAPASLVAQGAEIADLDGPLLLSRDRKNPIPYDGGVMGAAPPELWGAG